MDGKEFIAESERYLIGCLHVHKHHKTDRLFKQFCHYWKKSYARHLLHTADRYLSKENCLDILVEMFDTLQAFLKDRRDENVKKK